ncbi:MAG: pilus assembly protein TadG-related protein [Actinobacteria bacterium]|nr:pilus assembly protein TadG-related protein [Actinomycetota bacterium]
MRLIDPGDERGTILLLMALLMVVLLGVVGFAVDLGWLFWNSIEIQHGADAASLSGVVYVAEDTAQAKVEGRAAAAENGYLDTTLGGPDVVAIIDFTDDPSAVANPFQLRATVTHRVPTFFMNVFGMNGVDISRTAVAEYVLPLPLGSPEPYFGNDPALGRWPNFWGNIHGYYTGKGMGDRYSSQCVDWQSASGCTKNDERRQSLNAGNPNAEGGYVYGIEIDPGSVGSLLTVELFDPQFTRGGGDHVLVGDNPQGNSPGPATTFMLYDSDPTPLNLTDGNVLECSVTYGPRDPYADFNMDGSADNSDDLDGDGDLDWDDVEIGLLGGVAALWEPLCTIPITEAGIFPLRVMINDSGGSDQRGLNRWSLRAFTSGGPTPRVYGLGDMAIYANVDGTVGDTEFHLAEVDDVHAGKGLVIELWDPGDASGNHSVEIRDPSGNTPPCTWTAEKDTGSGSTSGTESSCVISTSGGKYNSWLVTIRVTLPADYTCSDDCWWKIHYNYPGKTQDTTTWSAHIEGNPLRLVE